ncbi:MAG: PDZ domain-containing protein [Nitrospirae bacterium]|nr:MAG: PDZ domain-containing protein [Nitrospirota bacterium]
MNYSSLKKILLVLILCSFSFSLAPSHGNDDDAKLEASRARIIAYILNTDLTRFHFTKKGVDDDLSKAAFGLYLKQLDPQKRYLLQEDIIRLQVFADKIDDEIKSSNILLPELAASLLTRRTAEVQELIRDILLKDFDFSLNETAETDAEKLEFCNSPEELRERWRKTLKYQVLHRYLGMLEEEEKGDPNAPADKEKKKPGDLMESARTKIAKDYETIFARLRQEKPRERYDRYFAAVAKAFDPHTDYMPPVEKEDFDIGMKGSLEGIGATLKEDEGNIKVVSIVPGGPAYKQGALQPEDTIVKVREGKNEPVDITDLKLREAIKLIRGKKGTEVTLTVKKPSGVLNTITIIRDVVQLEEGFAKSTLIKDDKSGQTFGYLRIPTFYRDFEGTKFGRKGRNVTDDVRNELKKFESEKIGGLVLDLRNNGGGALTDAVRIAGLFIKTGPVVQVKGSDQKVSVLSDDDPEINYNGPLTVLVNKFSASASEILAGALQDYGRAVIIGGEHTHGKGTVQTIIDLNDDMPFQNMDHLKPIGALRMTTQKFYRITGESTQYRGITPDIILPDKFTGLKSGEQFLEYALPWDKIGPATYAKWPTPVSDLTTLRSKSSSRVSSLKDFTDIETYSRKVTEQQKKTVRTLNLQAAKIEVAETKLLRDNEGKGPHSPHGAVKKGANGRMTEEEKNAFWNKEVSEDAYVREGISVILDMLPGSGGITVH